MDILVFVFSTMKEIVLMNYCIFMQIGHRMMQNAPKKLSMFAWLERSGVYFMGMYNGSSYELAEHVAIFNDQNPKLTELGDYQYDKIQSRFDSGNMPKCYYWSPSNFLPKLSSEVVNIICDEYSRMPLNTNIEILHIGGAVSEKDEQFTPFTGRGALHELHTISNWDDPEFDYSDFRAWGRNLAKRLTPHKLHGGYVNFNLENSASNYFGLNYQRLVSIKSKYDSSNVFHYNHNINPKL